MSKYTAIALATSALVLLSGCQGHRGPHDRDHKADSAAIEKQLKDIETQWNADYAARSVDAITAHYADDAALANPGAALATDAASRRAGISQFIADPNLKIEFASDRVQVARSGDIAYTRGHYATHGLDPVTKKPRTDTGTYLTVWQKQADDSWKAVEDAVIPGAPAAG